MKKVFSFLIVIMLAQLAYSQETIKGVVVDKATNEPLIGVSVYNPETGVGVSTSLDGSFSIKLKAKQSITISYIGYTSQTIQIGSNNSEKLIIQLHSEAIGLNDVTVTSSLAIRRKTPVALSVIDPLTIENKIISDQCHALVYNE